MARPALSPPHSGTRSTPRWRGWLRWGAIPLLIGGGLLAALLLHALVGGARDAALRTAVLLGAGDLTIQPTGARDGEPGTHLILESGAVYTNPALMRMPARIAARIELRVEVAAGQRAQVADLIGVEGPADPQAVLLAKSLVSGTWPAEEREHRSGSPGVVLGQAVAERLEVKVGDTVQVRTGAPGVQRAWRGRVAAILRTGLLQLDAGRIWTSAAAGQALLALPESAREEAASRLAVYLEQPNDAAEWFAAVRRLTLPEGVEVLTWRQVDPDALPWPAWQRVTRRASLAGYGLVGGTALLAALLGALANRSRSDPRWVRSWTLLGPPLVGVTAAVLGYAALWGLGRIYPLPAGGVFAALGPELNPFGALTGPVAPELGVSRALVLCVVTAGWYALAAVLIRWFVDKVRGR